MSTSEGNQEVVFFLFEYVTHLNTEQNVLKMEEISANLSVYIFVSGFVYI